MENTTISSDDLNNFDSLINPLIKNNSDYDLFCDGEGFVAKFY